MQKNILKDGKFVSVEVVERYAITVLDPQWPTDEAMRNLVGNEHHTYATPEEAEFQLKALRENNSVERLAQIWPLHESFAVRAVECYENGYILGIKQVMFQ